MIESIIALIVICVKVCDIVQTLLQSLHFPFFNLTDITIMYFIKKACLLLHESFNEIMDRSHGVKFSFAF